MEGGGVWGIAYAGALEELDKAGILADIKRVAGTSVGSIVTLLLALGFGSNDISKIVAQLDFKNSWIITALNGCFQTSVSTRVNLL